jgi:hypothetical protein
MNAANTSAETRSPVAKPRENPLKGTGTFDEIL